MKFGPTIKLDKKSKAISKKCDDDVMSAKCDVIVIFPIYDQFGAIQKLYSERTVCITYFFLSKVTFYLTKTENRTEKSLSQLSHY